MEDARLVHSTLGHQEMEVRMKIDPVPEGLEATLAAGEVRAIPTGICLAIPEGYVGLIWDKSRLSLAGPHRLAGVVDAGYRGEVRVVMVNLGSQPFTVEKGMKIARMLIQPIKSMDIIEVDELDETSRGEGGFGSTGRF